MIKTTSMLTEELREYASPANKLKRMVAEKKLIPIVKGLYETDGTTPGYLLAGSIYGPSYISFEFALSYHGLIPETVYAVTCATFEKKKKKRYSTPFGEFTYRDVPSRAFSMGVLMKRENDYFYRIATPEKALCDQLYTLKPASNIRELEAVLESDLRIDKDALVNLDRASVEVFSESYHTTNIYKLCSLLRRLHNGRNA